MGLSTWVAFTPAPDGAMVMGDIVVTEKDFKPFSKKSFAGVDHHGHPQPFCAQPSQCSCTCISAIGTNGRTGNKGQAVLGKVALMRRREPPKAQPQPKRYKTT
jgi:hypothetical protein